MSASLLSGAAAGCRCARDPAVGSGMPCLAVAHGLFLHLDQRLHWVLVCRLGPGRLVRRERCRAHMVCAGAWLLADDALRLVPRRLGCRQLQRAGQLCGVPRPQLSSALAPLAAPALGASQVVRGGVPARTASLAARANARRAGCLAARVAAAGLRSGRGRSMPRPDGAGARAVVGGRVLLLWAGPAVLHVRLHLERARLGQGAAAVELCADRRAGAPARAAPRRPLRAAPRALPAPACPAARHAELPRARAGPAEAGHPGRPGGPAGRCAAPPRGAARPRRRAACARPGLAQPRTRALVCALAHGAGLTRAHGAAQARRW